jgi:hypothetical protein
MMPAADLPAPTAGFSTRTGGQLAHADSGSARAVGQLAHADGGSAGADGQLARADGDFMHTVGQLAHADGGSAGADGQLARADGDLSPSSSGSPVTAAAGRYGNGRCGWLNAVRTVLRLTKLFVLGRWFSYPLIHSPRTVDYLGDRVVFTRPRAGTYDGVTRGNRARYHDGVGL